MDRRIFGIENEYGVTFTLKGQRRLSPDEVARYLFRRVVSWGRSSNVFLENGARLYLDVGSHPEYATPECDRVNEVVTHDKAGEWILSQLVKGAEEHLHEEGVRGEIFMFKNNTDSAGNSYGCHENYLTDRDDNFSRHTEVLIPFLISRQIYAGAGKILQTAKGPLYCLSQRAEHIWESVSSATTRSRPIINTRDEPHADAERFRRLHVIVGDSNMSEPATFLKVGATSVLLTLLEDKSQILRDLTLENPIRAIREISQDITLQAKVRLANGREITALEIQTEYLERALKYRDLKGFGIDESRALDMWARTIDQLKKDPSELWRECDWVAKLRLIEQFQRRDNISMGDPKASLVDLMYHDVDRDRGLYYKLQKADQIDRTTTDEAIGSAMVSPPATTRARLRGAFVKRAKERRRDYTVDWVHLKLNDQAQRTVLLKDPFQSQDDRVDRLIESL
jgi:proteasome accessory factor A